MCGIVGVVAPGKQLSADLLNRSLRVLHHRGPDSQDHWINSRKTVGLGHARLSIMDLSTGQQPISNEDGSIRAVVNGEFYDFERIRAELVAKGHAFRTRSDSEILVHLYEEYGTRCLEQLRGEFAFILWDERNQLLFAARDRFGIKPLYYSKTDQGLYLASEAKALFAAGVPAKWSLDTVNQSIWTAVPSTMRSYFENVFQVPPGHLMIFQGGFVSTRMYWDFNNPEAGKKSERKEEDLVEEFRERFDEAVRLRLRSDVPVAFYLSGGLDFSAVVGFATRHLLGQGNRKISTFTISLITATTTSARSPRRRPRPAAWSSIRSTSRGRAWRRTLTRPRGTPRRSS